MARRDSSGVPIRRRCRFTEAGRAVLSGLHLPRFGSAIAFFEPAQQDKPHAVAQRARVKQAQGLPLTEQEKRLSHYRKTAAEVRADWQKTLRRVGTIDGWVLRNESIKSRKV